jgi:multidrug efflux pump subunit AcrB
MLTAVIEASVRFRFLLAAAAAALMIAGVVTLPKMPVDVLPETSPVVVQLQTEAQGLSAAEVETLVTLPLEKELLEGIMGVVNVTSDSIPGLSSIVLHFAPGTNVYQARQLVQERLTAAFVLPNVSRPPVMVQPLSTTSNVMIIGLSSRTLSQIDLSVLARWTIVPRLLGVAGVAEVATYGQADRQLQVLVNPATLAADHITVDQLVSAAGNSQLVSPLSFLEGSTPGTGGFIEDQNQRITIRPILPFGTPATLAEVPITGVTAGGRQVTLGQVADIVQGHQPLIGDGLIKGKPGLVLVIEKLPGASVTGVTSGIGQALDQLRPALAGVSVATSLFRPASYLSSAESNLRLALIAAVIAALLALIALLLSFRLAFAALAAMAVSLTTATLALWALGYSFNALVLLGLVLALAVVAGDAVRCGSAALARPEPRPEPRSAPDRFALSLREHAGPYAAASVAALVAAVPIFVASGVTASFLHPMVVAYGIAVIVSMAVALTVTPALVALVSSWSRRRLRGEAVARRIQAWQAGALRGVLRVPAAVLALLGAASIAALAWTLPQLHPARPVFQDRNLVVSWNGAPGMSLPELDRISVLASDELLALPGVQSVAATLGRAVYSSQLYNTYSGNLWVTVKPGADYAQALAGIRAIVTQTPGMRGSVSTYEDDAMAGVLTGAPHTVTVRVYGPDLSVLTGLAARVRAIMSRTPGLRGAHVTMPVEQPTINVEVNLAKAIAQGLSPGDVRREAGVLLSGLTVGNFFQQQKVFDVVVWAQPSARSSLTSIRNMPIDNGSGGVVPLGDVATISMSAEPADIQHQDMSPFLDVTATATGSAGAAGASVGSRLTRMSFPLEYRAAVQAAGTSGATSPGMLTLYALAALLGIVLIVQAATGSWRLTAVVLLAVPVPVAGAAAVTLAVGPTSLGAAAGLLGVLALALHQATGIAARIGRRPEAGGEQARELSRAELLAWAAQSAPPVLTAAVATAALLVPFIALGDVAGNELIRPAAITIVCGLLAATAVNLLLLPAACLKAGGTGAVRAAASGRAEAAGRRRERLSSAAAFREAPAPAHGPARRWLGLALVAVAVCALAGCGQAAPPAAREAPPARMELIGPRRLPCVVLTPLGARRIGIQTAPATLQGTLVSVPYSALLYEPNGQTAVYTRVSALAYTRQFVTVSSITGNVVLLSGGLTPGTVVVAQGAEELLGVQNGVGVET